MTILGSTKLGTSVTGHGDLVALTVEQADLDADIDPVTIEDEVIERFIQCGNHALPYFSVNIIYLINGFEFIKFHYFSHKWNQPNL